MSAAMGHPLAVLAITAVLAVLATYILSRFLPASGKSSGKGKGAAAPIQFRVVRCVCCHREQISNAALDACVCAWNSIDVLDDYNPTCSVHRARRRAAASAPTPTQCAHRPVTTSAGPFCELCGEEL